MKHVRISDDAYKTLKLEQAKAGAKTIAEVLDAIMRRFTQPGRKVKK